MSNELREGVKHCIHTRGIAYTYSNDGTEGNRVVINPEWVQMHSEPMSIIDINSNTVSINTQPLVFKNRLTAEGALMLLQLMYPEETASFIIDKYDTKNKVFHFEIGDK